MTRVVYVPGLDRAVPLRIYIDAVKLARTFPDMTFRTGLSSWWPTTGREIVGQFREGVHDRINQQIPYRLRGRSLNQSRKYGKEPG